MGLGLIFLLEIVVRVSLGFLEFVQVANWIMDLQLALSRHNGNLSLSIRGGGVQCVLWHIDVIKGVFFFIFARLETN
jgi:hypothetical protein